jgi:gliding motility-associated-like protein
MKLKISFLLIGFLLAISIYSQQTFCADSSIRIRYTFGDKGATLFNNPDTAGLNIFTGESIESFKYGIAFLKTTWGDSMIWAKKYYINGKDVANRNSFPAPNGTIVCTGIWGGAANNKPEILIDRVDTNGNMLWAKRFKLTLNHLYYYADNRVIKNILIANNAIYFTATIQFGNLPYDYASVIAKLDLDGNLVWSRSYGMNLPASSGIVGAPIFFNNEVIFLSTARDLQSSGPGTELYTVLTKLNDADGSVTESNSYKILNHPLLKGIGAIFIKNYGNKNISVTGQCMTDPLNNGSYIPSSILFNSLFDDKLNTVHNYFYSNNNTLNNLEIYADYNNNQQHAFLGEDAGNSRNKFFLTFGKNDEILRSRKLNLPSTFGTPFRNSVNLDDKQNLHFLYHFTLAGKLVTEYARISNFAPTGTLGCFGKDTSIFNQYSFSLTKAVFTWNNLGTDVLTSNDVAFIADTAIVTKELVCKIVSLCNNVKIKGPASVCVGVPVRYTVTKNDGCFKNLDWLIDTTMTRIVNTEGDSAITLNFKKNFNGYIRAALTDCVVKDSFLIKAVVPVMPALINRKDSVLCPGKTIMLNANSGYSNYLWQSTTASQQLTVSGPGTFVVTASDSCGLTRTDSIRVTLADTSLNLPITQTICLYDTAFIALPGDVNNIIWQPSSNSYLNNKTLVVYPQQTTLYTISAEHFPACVVSRSSEVIIKICPQTIFIPNSFTPNNDGNNEIFKPAISQPLSFYHLQIINHYGQIIFESSSQYNGWDGSFKGSRQPMGGYTYLCSYRFAAGVQKMMKGYFILIR